MNSESPNKNLRKLVPENWVAEYSDTLYGYVCGRIADSVAAEDIVQETFLSAWRAKDSYKGDASEKNWLFAICKNKIIDYYRKCAKDIVSLASESQDYFGAGDGWNASARPKEWGVTPDSVIESKEFYTVLNLCKEKLQELQKGVFVLKYLEDMDSADICKELQISSSNYWTLMHRAKLQMRGCIEKNWFNKSM